MGNTHTKCSFHGFNLVLSHKQPCNDVPGNFVTSFTGVFYHHTNKGFVIGHMSSLLSIFITFRNVDK